MTACVCVSFFVVAVVVVVVVVGFFGVLYHHTCWFSFVSQTLSSCSYPGAVSQEEREEGDGGERDAEYQETLGQNGLQRPPQLQDYGTSHAIYIQFYIQVICFLSESQMGRSIPLSSLCGS